MVTFNTTLQRYNEQGEKYGWTYVEIPKPIANQLYPGRKKSFRVKGKIDQYVLMQTALIPIGNGVFMLPVNATMRKALRKSQGQQVQLEITVDDSVYELNPDLMACLEEDTDCLNQFNALPPSEQRYFSKWIKSAKTDATKTKRIVMTLNALQQGWGYSAMIRASKVVS